MYVAEPRIAASRGRGEFNQQQLEINNSGTSNTITSANKDNLLIEPNVLRMERTEQCKQLRKMNGDKGVNYQQTKDLLALDVEKSSCIGHDNNSLDF